MSVTTEKSDNVRKKIGTLCVVLVLKGGDTYVALGRDGERKEM